MINKENGNALFLILIAVALFAALSYAVTQSGRSGGGVDKEKTTIKAARLIQYTSELQQTTTRMLLTGTTTSTIEYTTALFNNIPCSSGENCVFAPEGGGVSFQSGKDFGDATAGSGEFVGEQGYASSADDIIFLISKLSLELCAELNKQLNITNPPQLAYPDEPYYCYDGTAGNYIYVHIMAER